MGGQGRRCALCIGIDQYATAPLAGCVADARAWAQSLKALGFEDQTILLDREGRASPGLAETCGYDKLGAAG